MKGWSPLHKTERTSIRCLWQQLSVPPGRKYVCYASNNEAGECMFVLNDELYKKLGDLGYTGSLVDRMYKHLEDLGHTQLSISDRFSKEGGYKAYTELVLSL